MITKIFLFLLIFSILFILNEGLQFYKALMTGEKNITKKRLIGIGLALSYIITIIFTGFGL